MKKKLSFMMVALLSIAAFAATVTWKVTGETAVTADTSIFSDDELTVKTVFTTQLTAENVTINGQEFTHYINVRVDKFPTAEIPTGTKKNDTSSPLVFTPKKDMTVTVYYLRQPDGGSGNTFTPGDGKDLRFYDQSAPTVAINGATVNVEKINYKIDPDAQEPVTDPETGEPVVNNAYVWQTFSLEANKTYTLCASGTTIRFYGLTYKSFESVANVAALNALADKADFKFSGEATVQAMPKKGSNVYCYIKDDTGWTLIYDAGGSKTAGLEVGKKIAANWDGAVNIYNGLFEAVPAAALTATEDPAVTPTFETVPVTAVTAENVNKIVKFEGVTIASVSGNDFKVKSGELSVAGYNQFAVEGLANGAVVNMTGAIGIYNTTVQFQPIEVEVVTPAPAPAPIEISPASGADIAAALEEATAVQTPTSITINLAAGGAYTVSAPIVPSAAFTINGNGATIDASGFLDAFIKMSKQPSVEKVESGQYVVAAESKIDNVKITGLTRSLFADNGTAYAFETFTISNSVFNYDSQPSVVLNFANAMAINFNITNSTFFSLEAGSANFIALSGKRPWQITGHEDVDGKLTVDHNTFYNVAKAKQFLNTNTLKGQHRYKYEMNSNIFVDVSNKKIYGNMTNNTNQVITDSKNTYLFEGVFFAETNYNGDEGLQTDPGFKDAANGDFTLSLTSDQNTAKTGDPRWIAYSINVADGIENGSVVPDVTSAAAGTVVTLTATPAEGYELDAITVTGVTTEIAVTVTDGKFTMPADAVTVNATFKKAPADVTVAAGDITDGDITAAIAAKAAGAPVKNLTINLATDGAYKVTAPIEAGASIMINGATGATIDASALTDPFIALSATPTAAFLPKNDGSGVTDYYGIEKVDINNVKVTGLKNSIFWDSNKKYCVVDFKIDNCVFALATEAVQNEALISFQAGGAKDFAVKNSTISGNNAVAKYFVRFNNSARIDRYGFVKAEDTWSFTYENNTFYGLLKSDGQWGNYSGIVGKNAQGILTIKNNLWVDCDAQTMRRLTGSKNFSGFNAASAMANNVFNVAGAVVDQGSYGNGSDINGVVTFTDAAAGDFNATLGTEDAPATATTAVGDPRWTVTNKQIPANITIGATELEAAANDISAALATAATGKIVGNLTVNLAAGGAYKVTAPIEAGGSVVINGAEGAVIDASALTAPFIALSTEPTAAFLPKNDGSGNTDYYGIDKVDINNVKVTGLKQSIFWDSNKKYCVVDFKIDNCVFALATEAVQNEALIAFQAGGAKDFTVKNSTISGNNAVAKYFARYNNSARIDRYGFVQAEDTWSFTYENNTFYGLLNSDGQWGNYSGIVGKNAQGILTIKNNLWVDCDAQTMRRLTGSKNFSAFNAASAMANNVFNREGAVVDQGSYGNGSDLKGVVTFTDAANGDFNGKIKLAPGTVAPATLPGDARWTLTTEDTKLYIIGDMNGWSRTAMTEMTFNAEKQVFEYEYAPTTFAHLAFADYQMTEAEAEADVDWSIFNSTYRYAIGEGDQDVTLNSPIALSKVNGSLTLQPVKSGTSYTITVAADFSTVTITGEAEPAPTVEKLYIMGTGTTGAWDTTTEMTFNETTQAFEYEVTNNGTLYITFGDAPFTNWDDWNANNRIAIGPGNQDAPVGTEFDLIKVGGEGTLVLEAGSYKISVTKALKCTITTTTGINAVKADALKDAQIYTISGQRVDKAQKGLYIVNGRKVVIK
jgi:hypothetical protein